ncbi:MAG TPA: universal stress protein, partial [Pseudogracilibacillus sp.]|nr:universal stress protein [Pseudogracilibacillus sp.]
MEYKNVVIAVDGSKASEKAFNKSVEIAKRNDAKLIVAHIVDTRTFATAEAYDKSLSERAEKYARDLLNEYVENANEAGVKEVDLVLKYGSPKVAISKEVAPENDAD